MTDRQDEKEVEDRLEKRSQVAVYQGAFEAVGALLITAGIGYWLDGRFDTAPILLLVGTAIGFASFTLRLVRLGRWIQSADSGQGSEPPNDTEH